MASIEIRKNMIYISAMIFDENLGTKARKRQTTGLKNTKENLKIVQTKYLPKFEQQLTTGEMKVSVKVPTVKAVGEEYISIKREEGHRSYSMDDYERDLKNHVYPVFGDRSVDSITIAEVEEWQVKLLEKLKAKTIQDIRIPFNGLFNLALNKKLIRENPFVNAIKVTKKKDKKAATAKALELKAFAKNGVSASDLAQKIKEADTKRKDPFSEAELKILFETAEGALKNYIQIAFFTAIRPSEMIALTWDQVNFKEKYVFVIGAITGKEMEDERELNKSIKSVRIVYLSSQAIAAFEEQAKLTKEKGSNVFLNQYGKPYSSIQSIRDKLFKQLIINSKVRPRRLYDLRHSYASINLSKNRLPILFVSEQMGHADASVTLKEYSSYIADSTEDTLLLLQKAFVDF